MFISSCRPSDFNADGLTDEQGLEQNGRGGEGDTIDQGNSEASSDELDDDDDDDEMWLGGNPNRRQA